MRIRSIRPEFWSSEDVAAMDWHTRLVFIGLWSYVDDNGVGRDVERLITAALFPLDDDLTESSVRVHRALQHLSDNGQVTRYTVENRPYLHVTAFATNQVINRASKGRYPLPTCGNAEPHGTLTEPSVSPPAEPPLGEGEKGRRGEGEKHSPSVSEPRKRGPRGTRLPEHFPVTEALAAWAQHEAPNAGTRDHDDFCDYWHSKAGKDAVKVDWDLTWKRWMRRASDDRAHRAGPRLATTGNRPGPDQRAAEVADLAAHLQAQHDARQHPQIGASA